ncbi:MAG: transposase [Flavobacterium sp.]
MSDKYKNKYRIPSSRLIGWDYGLNSSYFVTICTQNRTCFFGDVINEQMVLNEIGKLANDFWLQIPEKFPFAKLHNHVIMPNHMHGIIIIDKQDDADVQTRFIASPLSDANESTQSQETQLIASLQDNANVQTRFIASPLSDANESTQTQETQLIASLQDNADVQTRLIASLPDKPIGGITRNHNPMLHDNLSKIIRWYKGRTAFESRKINIDFAWQSRFHDHIIRNDESFQKISEYITNNPANWCKDQFYK